MTLCTVAIPVFNRAGLVRQALESALAQDVSGLDILVIDNCSTDGTWEVLQSYRDERLRLVQNARNLGLVGNMNECLSHAEGRYLRILCSDDRLPPGALKREIELMEMHPGVALLSGQNRLLDETGRSRRTMGNYVRPGIYAGAEAIYTLLWFHAYYGYNLLNYPSGIMLRRRAALDAGVFDEDLRIDLDFDFFLRVLQFGDLAIWEETGAEVLIHPGQENSQVGDAVGLSDLFQITERYRALLDERGSYARIRQQFAGISLGLAINHLLRGRIEEMRRHRALERREGASWFGMACGLTSVVVLRLLRKLTGAVFLPTSFRRSMRAL